jgi:hypothetical protein
VFFAALAMVASGMSALSTARLIIPLSRVNHRVITMVIISPGCGASDRKSLIILIIPILLMILITRALTRLAR